MTAPHPLLGWNAPRPMWLEHRTHGIGASDVATLLGLSEYGDTPWQLWAEKTGALKPRDEPTEAMQIGTELEPWLLDQAPRMLKMGVTRTPHMLYQHYNDEWKLASPDAFAEDGSLVEAKTAKLASYGDAKGWDDGAIPLGYELQARWQMHVMDRNRVYIVALVAGLGRISRVVDRDIRIEYDLARQVAEWRQTHLVDGVEPAVRGNDNDALLLRYADIQGEVVDLSKTNALELAYAYKQARDAEGAAKKEKAEPGAALKALMGANTHGKIGDQLIATWNPTKGEVDWQKMATDLAKSAGFTPDPERYRKPGTRTLLVKVK